MKSDYTPKDEAFYYELKPLMQAFHNNEATEYQKLSLNWYMNTIADQFEGGKSTMDDFIFIGDQMLNTIGEELAISVMGYEKVEFLKSELESQKRSKALKEKQQAILLQAMMAPTPKPKRSWLGRLLGE